MRVRLLVIVALFVLGFSVTSVAVKASGKGLKIENPVIVEENECVMDISGIDENDCTQTSAPDQSGYVVFNCSDLIVICPAE